ncbi:hypothetical protein C8J42_101949 [Sphingomonas sp. PP-CE-1A-559]|uniref:DUF7940 domain-containing protein n=1 Tax=Sphingomonas sp. PP-CE-1A-559 TaxID=2135657 RepID=UPI00105522A3|nr:hypothetical protein [Sphingomonas sp. PP-CE-1A-559]TCP94483.1 hypothetical protein C8J42_101949 [Sphingomonas sp. PP-CE-1A-559]
MKLIPNWRHAWRLASVRVATIGAVATTAAAAAPDTALQVWQSLPDAIRDIVPSPVSRWVTPALFVATLVARILKKREATDGE